MKPIINTRLKTMMTVLIAILTCSAAYGCSQNINNKGAINNMQPFNIGRFSIAVPDKLEIKIRSSKLGYVDIKEVTWPKGQNTELARTAEWDQFTTEVNRLVPPEGKNKVIINTSDFQSVGKWAKGVFYYKNSLDDKAATWALLIDSGHVGVWLEGDPSVVEKEKIKPLMEQNIESIAKAYQSPETIKTSCKQQGNCFYLQHGAINMPYFEQEESIARFEGHPLITKLLIEMEMDMNHEIEPLALIKGTKAVMAAALITQGGSISKVRLNKREVAGMPGEEAVLKVREGKETNLVFSWEFNGKDDSGEYPTTRINMEASDGNLEEKLKIWDAILDSMKPMFVRKK